MEEFVTVATFTYPTELAIIKGRLESEGIECYVKDEMTVQVYNFLSNAVGGIKLQVKQSDAEKAIEILKELGYLKEKDFQPPKFWIKLNNLTRKIPIISKTRLELRLMILAALFVTTIVLTVYIITIPTTYEYLTEYYWCVDQLTYDGHDYQPNSAGIHLFGMGFCVENINFRKNGTIIFPGFNSSPIWGSWTLTDNILYVSQVDTFQHIFQGNYNIDIDGNLMTLISDKTILHCYKTR